MRADASRASSTATAGATGADDPTRFSVRTEQRRTKKMKSIKVGLLGIGTVGEGTFNVLKRNQPEIRRRAGRGIEITMVSARNLARAAERTRGECAVVADPFEIVNSPDIDIVIELI